MSLAKAKKIEVRGTEKIGIELQNNDLVYLLET
jgi:hypothetical protein